MYIYITSLFPISFMYKYITFLLGQNPPKSPNPTKKKAAEKQTTTTKMQPEISDHIFYSFLTGGFCASTTTSSFFPFAIEDTIAQDKALASLRNHKEAERRRRERINSHLSKLRNLLSCNSKVLNFYFTITTLF